MAGVTKAGQNFASSVGQDTNNAITNTNSRYAVLKSSDVSTSLSECIEIAKSENEERSKKRGYEDLTDHFDTPAGKRQKLDSDSPLPTQAISVDTDIFDRLPKGFPGLSEELIEKVEEIRLEIKIAKKQLTWVVQKLCSISPLSVVELAVVINREESSLTTYTREMTKQGRLFRHDPHLDVPYKHRKFGAPVPEQKDFDLEDTDTSTPTVPVETDILDFLPKGCPELSEELKQRILKIRICNRRNLPEEIQEIIKELCSIIPFSTSELAIVLNRKESTILKGYIGQMIETRSLFCTDPSKPQCWKEQKFVTAKSILPVPLS